MCGNHFLVGNISVGEAHKLLALSQVFKGYQRMDRLI